MNKISRQKERLLIFPIIALGFIVPALSETLIALGMRNNFISNHSQDVYIALSFISFLVYVLLVKPMAFFNINTYFSLIFLFFLFFGSLWHGIEVVTLLKVGFLYCFAVVSYSAGKSFVEKFHSKAEIYLFNTMKISILFLLLSLALYLYSFIYLDVPRVGYSNPIGNVMGYFYLQNFSPVLLLLVFSIALLTGKRSVVLLIFVLLLIFFRRKKRLTIVNIVKTINIFIILSIFIYFLIDTNFFDQYFSRWFVSRDVDDWVNTYSSGRYEEIMSGFNNIISNPLILLTGIGSLGQMNILGDPDRWYIHSAIMTHILYAGLLPTLFFYWYLTYLTVKSYLIGNLTFSFFYSTVILLSTIISMNLFINPLFWFFLAILQYQVSLIRSKSYTS